MKREAAKKGTGDTARLLSTGSASVRAYLVVTGSLFGLLALAPLLRTIAEWSRMATDPGFLRESPGIAVVAGVLCLWGCRLLWWSSRS